MLQDGRLLASYGDDGALQIWDLESGEHRNTLRRDRPYERVNINEEQGLSEAQRATQQALGAVNEITLLHNSSANLYHMEKAL